MNQYNHKYQHLSRLVGTLPETVSAARYIASFRAAVGRGDFAAVPLTTSFEVGTHTYKDDMVRIEPDFTAWHERTVLTLNLYRERRGVAAYEKDVLDGTADFDELAKRYRQQLTARASVKPPQQSVKRGKPKLAPSRSEEQSAAGPTPMAVDDDRKAAARV